MKAKIKNLQPSHGYSNSWEPIKSFLLDKKDLYGNSVSDYKDHIDPMLNRTYKIRNIMEHQY
ncbi:hypothetical protein [Enterococcus casseliflavus]|uniref:hypothetical protein n=1 Tax=Enterococcus casseliflavus TaxID=37734 RepID=UPI0015872F75